MVKQGVVFRDRSTNWIVVPPSPGWCGARADVATPRRRGRAKDSCQFICGNDPHAETLDGRAFLTLNGVQTLGHAHITVAGQIPDLASVQSGCLCKSRILQE